MTPKQASEALKFLRRDSREHAGGGVTVGVMHALMQIERGVYEVPPPAAPGLPWILTHCPNCGPVPLPHDCQYPRSVR